MMKNDDAGKVQAKRSWYVYTLSCPVAGQSSLRRRDVGTSFPRPRRGIQVSMGCCVWGDRAWESWRIFMTSFKMRTVPMIYIYIQKDINEIRLLHTLRPGGKWEEALEPR